MKKRLLVVTSIFSLSLLACGDTYSKNYSNPLNEIEKNEIFYDVKNTLGTISSCKTSYLYYYDTESLYPTNYSATSSNKVPRNYKTLYSDEATVFSNHIIKGTGTSFHNDSQTPSDNYDNSYEEIIAALPMPSSASENQEYQLFAKRTETDSRYPYSGTSFRRYEPLIFSSNEANLDQKFNEYVSNHVSNFSLNGYLYRDGDTITCITYNSSSWDVINNPLFPNERAKTVPAFSKYFGTITIKNKSDGHYYEDSNYYNYESTAYYDFQGNKKQIPISQNRRTLNCSYDQRGTMQPTFTAEEAIIDTGHEPFARGYVEDATSPDGLTAQISFYTVNKSVTYQQIHQKGHEYSISMDFGNYSNETKASFRYVITDQASKKEGTFSPVYLPSSFKMEEGLTLLTYDDKYFNVTETGSSPVVYPNLVISVILDEDYQNPVINIAKKKGN